jgi:hypothetical protein
MTPPAECRSTFGFFLGIRGIKVSVVLLDWEESQPDAATLFGFASTGLSFPVLSGDDVIFPSDSIDGGTVVVSVDSSVFVSGAVGAHRVLPS